jgi:hypothetical protein
MLLRKGCNNCKKNRKVDKNDNNSFSLLWQNTDITFPIFKIFKKEWIQKNKIDKVIFVIIHCLTRSFLYKESKWPN